MLIQQKGIVNGVAFIQSRVANSRQDDRGKIPMDSKNVNFVSEYSYVLECKSTNRRH